MAISHCYWHLMVKNGNFTFLLISIGQHGNFTFILPYSGQNGNFTLLLTCHSGQHWQFHIAADIYWSRMAISHCYWHLVVKNGNFTLLLTSTGQNGNFTLLLTSSGQEWQFHIATDIWVVKNGNFTLPLTCIGQQWQFHIPTDIYWSRMAISHCYWHLLVTNGNWQIC